MADETRQADSRTLDQLRESVEKLTLRTQEKVLESTLNYYDNFVDPREPLYDDQDFWFPMANGEAVPPNQDNRKHGEVLPVFLTWQGLKSIRDQSRRLLALNEFAINAVENRVSYIVGKGFGYQAVRKGGPAAAGDEPDELCQQAQRVLDEFLDRSRWGELEQEIVRRCDRDGEAFVRVFHVGQGHCDVRFIEPEHVRPPQGDQHKGSFGIESDAEDVESVTGYWVIENPALSDNPELVPADEIVHIKLNVDRNAKRGVPTLHPVRKNLERAEKLLRNMSLLAQVQATFALIRKHKGVSAAAVDAWQKGQADVSVNHPSTNRTHYYKMLQPGRIVDVPESMEYEFPAAGVDAASYVAILQAELRAVAARLVMPEYMLTADASNNNYASSLVAEAPAVKNFERLQAFYSRHFGDGSYGGPVKSGVLWRVLAAAVEWNRLPAEVLTVLEIQVEGPTLVVRDKAKETARARQLHDAGILSSPTWAKWEGLDFEQEQRQGAGVQQQEQQTDPNQHKEGEQPPPPRPDG